MKNYESSVSAPCICPLDILPCMPLVLLNRWMEVLAVESSMSSVIEGRGGSERQVVGIDGLLWSIDVCLQVMAVLV